MDFSLTEEQQALAELAGQIFGDHADLARLKGIERSDAGFDEDLWRKLAAAGLPGAPLPEDVGGSGGGFVEACLVLERQGRRAVQVPYLATVVGGAMPIARFGTDAQRRRWLPGVVAGTTLLAAALSEVGADPRSPAATATKTANGWRLDGTKTNVPYARRAALLLVPARTPDGPAVFLVDPHASGVTIERQEPMNFEPQARVALAGVTVGADDVLGGGADRGAVLDWIVDRVTTGLCALAAGVCQEAVRLTAEYASNRKQFDKPIAMFQAVGQRMADCFIDNEAVTLTTWQAVTRLADEMPSAKEIATAKYWAADGGSRIGHAGLHVHGGISIDVDYPIHRHFLWLKTIEFTLGAATPQLVRLGGLLAAEA